MLLHVHSRDAPLDRRAEVAIHGGVGDADAAAAFRALVKRAVVLRLTHAPFVLWA
jgi:hypothetical protein